MTYEHTVEAEDLATLSPHVQKEVMEKWFRSRFEDPAERTPYESREGGYIWIWGGPYEAEEELRIEFEGIVDEAIIVSLARELDAECAEWGPVPSEDDYDHSLLEVVNADKAPRETLREAMTTIRQLLSLDRSGDLDDAMNRMLFANVIGALETYLCDTFVNNVLTHDYVLRQFIETTPDFQKRSVPYSYIFQATEAARDEARRHLLDVVWHNVAKVQAMFADTMNVDMRPVIADVARAIPKRHDIVHRNGRDRDGQPLSITRANVAALIEAVEKLADHVENELVPDF